MTPSERINELAEKVKNPPTWWWKVLGGVALVIFVLWIQHLLNKKAQELADAHTALATQKLATMRLDVAARVETDEAKRKDAEGRAKDAYLKVHAEEEALGRVEAEHALNLKKLTAVSNTDWDALNKLMGIK